MQLRKTPHHTETVINTINLKYTNLENKAISSPISTE